MGDFGKYFKHRIAVAVPATDGFDALNCRFAHGHSEFRVVRQGLEAVGNSRCIADWHNKTFFPISEKVPCTRILCCDHRTTTNRSSTLGRSITWLVLMISLRRS